MAHDERRKRDVAPLHSSWPRVPGRTGSATYFQRFAAAALGLASASSPVSTASWITVSWVSASGVISGCGAHCDRKNNDPAEPYHEGVVDRDRTHYATAPVHGRFLDFPGGKRYRLFHGLSARPTSVISYLSFTSRPLADGGGGFSESAGNQTVVTRITDRYIELKNDTCADFYLRVEANMQGPLIPLGSLDAGADGGEP